MTQNETDYAQQVSWFNQSGNISSNITGSLEPGREYSYWINYGNIALTTISMCCNAIALRIMSWCQKMPISVRYISTNFLAGFVTVEATSFVHSIAMLLFGDRHYQLIFDSRIFFGSVFICVLWCSLFAVTIERLIALEMPFIHAKYVSKKLLSVIIAVVWISNVLIPIAIFLITGLNVCSPYMTVCDVFAIFSPLKIFVACLLILYGLTTVIAYSKILLTLWHHKRNINAIQKAADSPDFLNTVSKKKHLKATTTITAIILVFVILQSPIFFHAIIFELRPDFKEHQWRVTLQVVSYIFYEINVYATLYLYIWKFKECKMNFYFLFSKFSSNFRKRAESLRIDLFDIVTLEKDRDSRLQNNIS